MSAEKGFDWIGHWFTLGDRTGEHSNILFAKITPGSGDPEIHSLPHARFDGATGLIHLLREHGGLAPDCLPRLPRRQPPSRWVRLREALKIFFKAPIKGRRWSLRNPAWQAGVSSNVTTSYGWRVLDREKTAATLARAKAEGVSLNSLLLKALGDAAEPHLDASRLPAVWLMPVAIHPELTVDMQPSNLSSYMDIYVRPGAGVQDVEREVRRLERNQSFWGAWLLLNLGRWFGERVVKAMVASNPKTLQKTGVFSNLGNWTGPSQAGSQGAWSFCPPVVAFQPLAASAITWNGQLVLGARLHPVLAVDPAIALALIDSWISALGATQTLLR